MLIFPFTKSLGNAWGTREAMYTMQVEKHWSGRLQPGHVISARCADLLPLSQKNALVVAVPRLCLRQNKASGLPYF